MNIVRRLVERRKRKPGQDQLLEATLSESATPLERLPVLDLRRRSVTAEPASGPQTQLSPFFSLPYELRHQIHYIVLGGREIHLDIAYTAVVAPKPHSTAHARLSGRAWRWRPSTCHRRRSADPGWDMCSSGGLPTDCSAHATPCCIGMLNWLLVCRQVYREGIEVLFAENTFHMLTGTILLSRRRLLVPQAVFITSLVLRLGRGSIVQYAEEHLGLQSGWPAYKTLFNAVPVAFPQLRKLYLVVEGALGAVIWEGDDVPKNAETGAEEIAELTKHALLGPADDILRIFRGQLDSYHFVLEKDAFDRFLVDDLASADTVLSGHGWKQFWRPISLELEEGVGRETTGYWVRRLGTHVVRRLVLDVGAEVMDPVTTVEIVE